MESDEQAKARDCHCYRCAKAYDEANPPAEPFGGRMALFIVCNLCGNKRCPHANDHRNACTGSNEPGQKGSAYE